MARRRTAPPIDLAALAPGLTRELVLRDAQAAVRRAARSIERNGFVHAGSAEDLLWSLRCMLALAAGDAPAGAAAGAPAGPSLSASPSLSNVIAFPRPHRAASAATGAARTAPPERRWKIDFHAPVKAEPW